ncbi:MAG: hemin uptake protein HemP [Sulfuricurvum sp.]
MLTSIPPKEEIPAVESKSLFKEQSCIRIIHEGETYFLRVTRNNKLILTK